MPDETTDQAQGPPLDPYALATQIYGDPDPAITD